MVCGQNKQLIIIITNIIIIYVLLRYLIKNYSCVGNLVKLSLIMVISGGLSNLVDRICRGYVVDYIDINPIFSYPVFNVADISIVVGVILLICYLIITTIKKQEKA